MFVVFFFHVYRWTLFDVSCWRLLTPLSDALKNIIIIFTIIIIINSNNDNNNSNNNNIINNYSPELANQHAPKTLFTCVVCTSYLEAILAL